MREIILIGNPNVGKSTLFNTITKGNQKTSNWHGVTVGEKSKETKIDDKEYKVTDLPGMYSVHGFSNEEKIANTYLDGHKNELIINICDANNLLQNLKLTKELINLNLKLIVAVNMINEVRELDLNYISKILGTKVIGIDARKKKGIINLLDEITSFCMDDYDTENSAGKLNANKKVQIHSKNSEIQSKFSDLSKYLNEFYSNQSLTESKIDKVLLNKFLFLPTFIILVFGIFFITFGFVGETISGGINFIFDKVFDIFRNLVEHLNTSSAVKSFLIEGIIDSVSAIFTFLPQIVILMLCLNVLEDTGFMSRVAFMLDGFMKKIGLTGKSIFSLFMGFGCTTSAVLTTRNLENKSLRKRTILVLPFSTCSAKLPVLLVISSLFFNKFKYFFVFLLYIFALFVSVVVALINKKISKHNEESFVMELPKYRLPYFKKIIIDVLTVIKDFILKVGFFIVFFGAVLWFLQNFSSSLQFLNGENFTDSMLYFIANKIAILFNPIGLGNAGVVAVLIFGLFAKELIVVGLSLINGVGGDLPLLKASLISSNSICHFTPSSSILFLIFILLYSPCISALGTIKNELGAKSATFIFLAQFLISWLVCFVIKLLMQNSYFLIILFMFLILAIIIKNVLKLNRKKNICRGNCSGCRGF